MKREREKACEEFIDRMNNAMAESGFLRSRSEILAETIAFARNLQGRAIGFARTTPHDRELIIDRLLDWEKPLTERERICDEILQKVTLEPGFARIDISEMRRLLSEVRSAK